MNENLNLVTILKDCPKGTKLYSTIHGEIEFSRIDMIKMDKHPIVAVAFIRGMPMDVHFTVEGKYLYGYEGECILFPSKDQRDWSKFKTEKKMVDGEFYYCFYGNNKKENSYIFIYKKHLIYKTKCYAALSMFYSILFKEPLITNNNENITELRKATEEEKQQLLNAIKREGYKWDEEKKELVRIEKKFDFSTLQHFDRVLVRDNNSVWRCDFYNSYVECMEFPFRTVRGSYKQCIPYNEDTKHLVDKNEKPPKKYITWEE